MTQRRDVVSIMGQNGPVAGGFRIVIAVLMAMLNYAVFSLLNQQHEMAVTLQKAISNIERNRDALEVNTKDAQDSRAAVLAIDRRVQRLEDTQGLPARPR